MTKIAIVGAGNVGGNLGINLTKHGFDVRFGVKPGADVSELLAKCSGRAQAASVADVARWADVIVLALPAAAVVEVGLALGDVTGKVLVDTSNPLRWADGPVHAPPPEGSAAAALAKAVPAARVVKAFNTFGAELHLDPALAGGGVDVPMAGDDGAAKELVADVARKAGFTPVDAGPLRNAAVLENLAVLWIHLAMKGGHGREFGFKMIRRS